jgi:mono/diheme cytochrome c family protein
VMPQCARALVGVLAAGVISLPVLTAAVAAPKKPAPKKPAAKAKGGDAKAGKNVFKSEGCTGCHKSKDYTTGGEIGPDLSDIGKEHDAKYISGYIKKPKSSSVMPAFKGPQKAVDDMTAYLLTQK